MKFLYFDETMEKMKVYNTYDDMVKDLWNEAPLGQEDKHYYFRLPNKIKFDTVSLDCIDSSSIINMLEDQKYKIKDLPDYLFD